MELGLLRFFGFWIVGPLARKSADPWQRDHAHWIDDAVSSIQPLIANRPDADFPRPPASHTAEAVVNDNLENLLRKQQVANTLLENIAKDVRRLASEERHLAADLKTITINLAA